MKTYTYIVLFKVEDGFLFGGLIYNLLKHVFCSLWIPTLTYENKHGIPWSNY